MVVTRWDARFMGRRFPVSIGRGGLTADKREGDGATPVGVWRLMQGGYRADRGSAPVTPLVGGPPARQTAIEDNAADETPTIYLPIAVR